MKTFNLKNKVIVAVATLGFAVSANAANPKTNFEQMAEAYVIAQSQQVMQELSTALQNNISAQLQQFSIKQADLTFDNKSNVQITNFSKKSTQKVKTTTTITTEED